jgi:hypothetical protein
MTLKIKSLKLYKIFHVKFKIEENFTGYAQKGKNIIKSMPKHF